MTDSTASSQSNARPTVVHSNHFVPRFGMYAGPGYAGGREWRDDQVPDRTTWQVRPVNFLDDVTRNHDRNYTYIERMFAEDDPARAAAYWQADKEMLINVLNFRPEPGDWLSATYRDALIRGFVAKAVKDYGIDIQAEWEQLGALDPSYARPPTTNIGDAALLASPPAGPAARPESAPAVVPATVVWAPRAIPVGATVARKHSPWHIVLPFPCCWHCQQRHQALPMRDRLPRRLSVAAALLATVCPQPDVLRAYVDASPRYAMSVDVPRFWLFAK